MSTEFSSTTSGGISRHALEAFRRSVRGPVLQAGDEGYDDARSVWNGMIDRRPAVIVRCLGPADVIAAVNFAREQGLGASVRCGGHNVAGTAVADGALMIDLSLMRGIRVDAKARTVRAQGGARWTDVDRETQVFGLATPSGYVSETGIGGFTLGGGYGALRRKHGMTCDSLISADIVTADGNLRVASDTENEDLFWALRGGGGNFGVVTSFEYRSYPVGPMVFLCIPFYPLETAGEVIRAWREFMKSAPEEISSNVMFWSIPAIPEFPAQLHNRPVVSTMCMYPGDLAEGERITLPMRRFAKPLIDLSSSTTYVRVQSQYDFLFPPRSRRYYLKSIDLLELTDACIDRIVSIGTERPNHDTAVPIWHFGGAMSRVDPTATAFWRRQTPYMVSVDAIWRDAADDHKVRAWTRASIDSLREFSDGGEYVNFPGLAEDGEAQVRAGYGGNYERLKAIKRKYDPENLFRYNVNIKP